jgi:hypothetical protein
VLAGAAALGGCVSAEKYRAADAHQPPARLLSAAFPAAPVAATLHALIVCGGPGAWKRDARWDEFVLTLRNPGVEPLAITGAELVDFSGAAHVAGADPWQLEAESARFAQARAREGVAFQKDAGPQALGATAASATVTAATGKATAVLAAAALENGVAQPALSGLVAVTGVAGYAVLPGFVLERVLANREARADIEAEFRLRRLALPVALAPGQVRAGCCFFPMGPNPRALKLFWRRGAESGSVELPLDFLRGLHVPASAAEK